MTHEQNMTAKEFRALGERQKLGEVRVHIVWFGQTPKIPTTYRVQWSDTQQRQSKQQEELDFL